jgi:hypothetical protein
VIGKRAITNGQFKEEYVPLVGAGGGALVDVAMLVPDGEVGMLVPDEEDEKLPAIRIAISE